MFARVLDSYPIVGFVNQQDWKDMIDELGWWVLECKCSSDPVVWNGTEVLQPALISRLPV